MYFAGKLVYLIVLPSNQLAIKQYINKVYLDEIVFIFKFDDQILLTSSYSITM